jgi:hypothetical protein
VGFPAVALIPAVAGVSAVAVIPAIAVVPAVAVVPTVDGAFAVASFSWYLYVLYYTMYRPSDYRTMAIGLWLSDYGYRTIIFFWYPGYRTIGIYCRISDWRIRETIGYRINATIYRTNGYRTHKKLSVAHL